MLTQIISEWTFHKYVDLLRSDIPAMYHESILQKLGYVAFEMTRESTLGNLSKDEMLKLVEIQLKKSYEKSCLHLLSNGLISQDIYDSAIKQSSIDSMTYTPTKQQVVFNTFSYTVAALCLGLVTIAANIFYYEYQHLDVLNTVAIVVLSMYIGFYVGIKKQSLLNK